MNRRCAVIGSGYWGENHIRILSNLNILNTFYDKNVKNKLSIEKKYNIKSKSINSILKDNSIDCIFITTPSDTHIEILKLAIKYNKNIFVEKPLVTNINDLNELRKLIKNYKKITMVGHLMIYHGAIIKIKELIKNKIFGNLKFIEFFRRNFGKIRNNETSFMSFTPHDFSIADFLTSKDGKSSFKCIRNNYSFYRNKYCYDMGNAKFLINNKECYFNYSWISPEKTRTINLYFEKGIIVFDDLKSWDEKLLLIKSSKNNIINSEREDINRNFLPINSSSEPLEDEIKTFMNSVINSEEVKFTSIKKCIDIYKNILTAN